MARSLKQTLRPGERVIIDTRARPAVLMRPIIFLLLISAGTGASLGWLSRSEPSQSPYAGPLVLAVVICAAVLAVLTVVRPWLRWLATRYILTTERLMVRADGSRRRVSQAWLANCARVHIAQGIFQRLAGAGDLYIDSSNGRLVLRQCPAAKRFAALINEAIDGARWHDAQARRARALAWEDAHSPSPRGLGSWSGRSDAGYSRGVFPEPVPSSTWGQRAPRSTSGGQRGR